MRCKNMGSDYGGDDDDSVSWSCTADVPRYFKLGSTDVLCEGYANAEDRYVLKGMRNGELFPPVWMDADGDACATRLVRRRVPPHPHRRGAAEVRRRVFVLHEYGPWGHGR